jgi:hypothetical protein
LRQEPSAVQTAIRIANDLSADEIAGSPVARNTLILLRQATERDGLPLTATGNLSRAVVAEMCKLIQWPDYDQADAFRLNKVINEPDFLPLHVVRQLAQASTLVRAQRGKLVATPLGKSMLIDARQRSLPAILFHLAFWHMDLGYFGRGLLGSCLHENCQSFGFVRHPVPQHSFLVQTWVTTSSRTGYREVQGVLLQIEVSEIVLDEADEPKCRPATGAGYRPQA